MARKDRRSSKKNSVDSNPATAKKAEVAFIFAYAKARLKENEILHTQNKSYEVMREIGPGMFGYSYEVKRNEDTFLLKTEPCTENKEMEFFKSLKTEMYILLTAAVPIKSLLPAQHILSFKDSGSTDNFKFLVMQPIGANLHDITLMHLKSGLSMSTALRTSIQTLRAVGELHKIGFLHRCLSPTSFCVGAGTKMRTVYITDFGVPYCFRNKETGQIKKPRSEIPRMGVLNYMSRAAYRRKEHCRRDDLESWMYMAMEFFDLKILPWDKCQSALEAFHKKRMLINGGYSSIFEKIPSDFRHIIYYISNLEYASRPNYKHIEYIFREIRRSKKIDFNVPYDWEVLSKMRDKLEADPITDQIPEVSEGPSLPAKSPVSSSRLPPAPKNEISKEESVNSPNLVSASIGSEISSEQTTPSTPIKKTPEEVKSEYFIPMAQRRILPPKQERNQSEKKGANQID